MSTKKFGELVPGDILLDPTGSPVTVKTVYEAHVPERMYAMTFEDGTTMEASGNHLWYIVTTTDQSLHQQRLKAAKKLLRPAPEKFFTGLEAIAATPDLYEVSMADVLEILFFMQDEHVKFQFVLRLLASLGHIVEESVTYQDLSTGDSVPAPMEKIYDGRLVAEQLLALSGRRKYKSMKIIKGRVVTTDEIFNFYEDADFPVIESLPARKR